MTSTSTATIYTTTESPVGSYLLTGVRDASAPGGVVLTGVTLQVWSEDRNRPVARIDESWEHAPEEFAHAIAQLQGYFAGDLKEFDLELEPRGSSFQRRVWDELRKIPYGSTTTYGKVTAALGLDRVAARAVGGAVGSNPLGILIPCHRVIGANGSLTGYADGLATKEALLVLEGVLPEPLA
ncbi:methylated-DNA--[protein]-cysteine S-methyltransferase [Actinospica sp.]|jgi:methylated-DNA-[protein]-cysteine S-methyltransferase|uniref:methylated-DNA--[protein]-cysteine S-methyltransferase n=1 Tax=Actinospica sp. TaxID=1872142 RepID=UPI002CC6B907|nr:methylated-DNA--[protein]-cysteine S-methyltransferase [Actinospica sp.]HWG23186.1 methylated-DNA--[protein]-cysteine S-methyltransferase [Actinospica sp.]